MKIIFLNRWRTLYENILTIEELREFVLLYKIEKFGASEYISLFKHFYKIDVNDYTIRDIIFEEGIIRINLKDEDLSLIRDKKINNILK